MLLIPSDVTKCLSLSEIAPEIFPFVFSSYSSTSYLQFGNTTILSAEGIQQGDPLGPLLFCLTIHSLVSELKSELKFFYLDDGTIAGTESDILDDLKSIERNSRDLGLHLNHSKTELIGSADCGEQIFSCAPDLHRVDPCNAELLGSPIGDMSHTDNAILDKVNKLKILSDRLLHLSKQDTLFLIRCALAIPKTLYLLRTAQCFHSPLLEVFDQEFRSLLNLTLNIPFEDHHTWLQATLTVGCGGLGVRKSVQLAPSAFLASAAASSPLIQQLLPSYAPKEDALNLCLQSVDGPPPSSPRDRKQQAWDEPQFKATYHTLIESAGNSVSRARLLAANVKESGAWINALSISAVGLHMNDDEVQLATAIHLGAPISHPYKCHLCGHDVDQYTTHGLSCYRNTGRHFRHAAINNIIHRSLATANIPSWLEPSGLSRSDGKRPDGVTIRSL